MRRARLSRYLTCQGEAPLMVTPAPSGWPDRPPFRTTPPSIGFKLLPNHKLIAGPNGGSGLDGAAEGHFEAIARRNCLACLRVLENPDNGFRQRRRGILRRVDDFASLRIEKLLARGVRVVDRPHEPAWRVGSQE